MSDKVYQEGNVIDLAIYRLIKGGMSVKDFIEIVERLEEAVLKDNQEEDTDED